MLQPWQFSGWFLVGNEGIRALYDPFKGICRALIPSFPTKNQGAFWIASCCMTLLLYCSITLLLYDSISLFLSLSLSIYIYIYIIFFVFKYSLYLSTLLPDYGEGGPPSETVPPKQESAPALRGLLLHLWRGPQAPGAHHQGTGSSRDSRQILRCVASYRNVAVIVR